MAQKFQINKQTQFVTTIMVAFVFLVSGVYFLHPFASDNSYAAEHTDNASGSYNGTNYSLSTTVSDLDLTLNALPSGNSTYGSQTVSVTTTAPGGYQLYVNTSGALASDVDSTTIPSVTGSNVALSTNTWGYTTTTPSHSNDTQANQDLAGAETIWNAVPTTITQIDSSSTATTNKTKTLYYGVKADNTLTDGNYNGTITYTTIANDATTDTLLSVSPTSGTAGQATTITITTSLMTTSTGISASDITATVGSYSCSSISITSTSPLTFTCSVTASSAGTYSVTATISKYNKTYTKSSAITFQAGDLTNATMQSSNIATLCKNSTETTSASSYTTYELTDSRDSQKYYVRKFTFNNKKYCMMVENLALAGGTYLTSTKSNVSTSWSLPSSAVSNFSPSGGTAKRMYNGASGTGTTSSANSRKRNGATYDGSYYNWCAATAGTGGCYNTSQAAGTYDICPKYWRMPTYVEIGYIVSAITSAKINMFFANASGATAAPIYSGYYKGSSLSYGSSDAFWWSSTQYESTRAYNLSAGSGSLYAGSIYKHGGLSVRCLVQASS